MIILGNYLFLIQLQDIVFSFVLFGLFKIRNCYFIVQSTAVKVN